jgi:hypothetical protein
MTFVTRGVTGHDLILVEQDGGEAGDNPCSSADILVEWDSGEWNLVTIDFAVPAWTEQGHWISAVVGC